jgi:hypothetical protein
MIGRRPNGPGVVGAAAPVRVTPSAGDLLAHGVAGQSAVDLAASGY